MERDTRQMLSHLLDVGKVPFIDQRNDGAIRIIVKESGNAIPGAGARRPYRLTDRQLHMVRGLCRRPRRCARGDEVMEREHWYFREQDEPSCCAWCGAKTPKLYGWVRVEAGEEYRGNAQVASRKPCGRHAEILRLNRGTYKGFDYGAFCKLRCAEAFANAAHDAGYRVKEN